MSTSLVIFTGRRVGDSKLNLWYLNRKWLYPMWSVKNNRWPNKCLNRVGLLGFDQQKVRTWSLTLWGLESSLLQVIPDSSTSLAVQSLLGDGQALSGKQETLMSVRPKDRTTKHRQLKGVHMAKITKVWWLSHTASWGKSWLQIFQPIIPWGWCYLKIMVCLFSLCEIWSP